LFSTLDGLNLHLLQSGNCRARGGGTRGGQCVRSSGDGLLAALAVPDSSGLPLDVYFSAEVAFVLAVLRNLDLLAQLSEGGSVPGSVPVVGENEEG